VNPNDFFKQASLNNIRGHMYKLHKQGHHTNVGASFFASRVIDVWNYLPENIVDFIQFTCSFPENHYISGF